MPLIQNKQLPAKKFRYALIGCGQAGQVHAWHFSSRPDIEPVGCMDIDGDRATRAKEDFGFPKAFTNLADLLDEARPEIVSIATPHSEHAGQLRAALERGIQVFCEKPLVITPEEGAAILELSRIRNIPIGVMLPRRFYNNSLAVREAIGGNRLGPLKDVRLTLECRKESSYYSGWRGQKEFAGGGVLMSQAIHMIDQLVFLFGKPVSASGKVSTRRPEIDVEDEAEGTIRFESGVNVLLTATTNSKEHLWRGLTTIEGERGSIVLESENTVSWSVAGMEAPLREEAESVPEKYKPVYYGPGHLKVIQNYMGFVKNEQPLLTPAEEAMQALKIIWGLYKSSQTGREARL